MKNYEKYLDTIKTALSHNRGIALIDGEIKECKYDCMKCDFNNLDIGCSYAILKWLFSETIPTITLEEKQFLEGFCPTNNIAFNRRHGKLECYVYNGSDSLVSFDVNDSYFKFINSDNGDWVLTDLLALQVE